MNTKIAILLPALVMLASGSLLHAAENASRQVYVVPNFHPASCGWLTDFSTERIYCANSYLDHLDRVRDDPDYAFAISEVNNMIAILNFTPKRFEELKRRIREGRVEPVNAFFLEPTINLSGGEALVKMGIEGIRWQEAMLGTRPRHCWMIDVTGMHEQMGQIVAGLGLDSLVYCRGNNSGSSLHWLESPDGSRALAVNASRYANWAELFRSTKPLAAKQVMQYVRQVRSREQAARFARATRARVPEGAPTLVLAGTGDYSLAPSCGEYPRGFLKQWRKACKDHALRFSTLSPYVDAVLLGLRSGRIKIPTVRGGWSFSWLAFWIQNPTVKQRYRRSEHALQSAEMLAAIAGLKGRFDYPSQDLYHAWLQMLLNMDRNTLWGAGAVGFEHPVSWDVRDRFNWVDACAARVGEQAVRSMTGRGKAVTLFNAANWRRSDPMVLSLNGGGLKGAAGQRLADGRTLCRPELPPLGLASFERTGAAPAGRTIGLPETIETKFYSARIDPKTGDLVSLKVKPSGREMLGGPANALVAETTAGKVRIFAHHVPNRPRRKRLDATGRHAATIKVTAGPLATIVEARSKFHGGKEARRVICFHHDHPRIDFDTYLEDIPNHTVVVAEFPLAGRVTDVRRGIPYGFSHFRPSGAADRPAKPAPPAERSDWASRMPISGDGGIRPAVRWSHYALAGGGGAAILDRGLTGREIHGSTAILHLLATSDTYFGHPSPWLSGKGRHHLQYAFVAHDPGAPGWADARIPQMAWEYNCPPIVVQDTAVGRTQSFVQTSDNVIVQALRREGSQIELRLAECLGVAGKAELTVNLPHKDAAMTDMLGGNRKPLAGGPTYRFDIRGQQIVTIRLQTGKAVAAIKPLTDWAPLVPEHKRPALKRYLPGAKGHPPRTPMHPLAPAGGKVARQKPDGSVVLAARSAVFVGITPGYYAKADAVGWWNDPRDTVHWVLELTRPGSFDVQITYGCLTGRGGSEFTVSVGNQRVPGKTSETGQWTDYITEGLGSLRLDKPGKYVITIEPGANWKSWSLKGLVLKPGS